MIEDCEIHGASCKAKIVWSRDGKKFLRVPTDMPQQEKDEHHKAYVESLKMKK